MTQERDDRRLVREVFTQTRIAPRPDLARRVRDRVAGERRRRARSDGGWQLMLAGGLLALAMVAGLLLDEGVLQWPAWGAPTPVAQTATLASSGPSAPTFLLPPAGQPGPMRRADWTGRTTGSFPVPEASGGTSVSPDGALVAVLQAQGRGADVLDSSGRLVARLTAFGAWSGDGAHVACALVADGQGLQIVVADLRDAARPHSSTVSVSGATDAAAGWTLGGCSAQTDRLVAFRDTGWPAVSEVASVRLSTGRLLSDLTYDDGLPPVAPALSPGARYLAENDPERRVASIRDLVSGEVIGHVSGLVVAFTGDARLVLVDSELGPPTPASRVALVDWRWHRTLWAGAGHGTPLAVRPGGEELALELTAAPAAPARALLVDAAGRALDLDSSPTSPGGSRLA